MVGNFLHPQPNPIPPSGTRPIAWMISGLCLSPPRHAEEYVGVVVVFLCIAGPNVWSELPEILRCVVSPPLRWHTRATRNILQKREIFHQERGKNGDEGEIFKSTSP